MHILINMEATDQIVLIEIVFTKNRIKCNCIQCYFVHSNKQQVYKLTNTFRPELSKEWYVLGIRVDSMYF